MQFHTASRCHSSIGTGRCARIAILAVSLSALSVPITYGQDVVEFSSGAKARGKIQSYSGSYVIIDVTVSGRNFQRRYPKSRINALIIKGKRIDLKNPADSPRATSPASATKSTHKERPREEVLAEIDKLGRTPPDWYESTPLNYPKTLDLNWPMPPPKGWNSQKNIGQFIWDRINPNQNKWREGVKFMHHILSTNRDKAVQKRAMRSLASMYHNLHEDYARAAFWYRLSGLEKELSSNPQPAVHLADSYWKLGSKRMALEVLAKMTRKPYSAIKLLGDLGETAAAISMAEKFSRTGKASTSFLYAGDACRVAGRLSDAENYYKKVLAVKPPEKTNKTHFQREQNRARASIAAIQFYTLDPKKVKDGKYRASSIGYEAQVEIEVAVSGGRIDSVKVTRHREKQYYSSIRDTPRKIAARQTVNGIDATSGATITSEAIINATAKALANGLN